MNISDGTSFLSFDNELMETQNRKKDTKSPGRMNIQDLVRVYSVGAKGWCDWNRNLELGSTMFKELAIAIELVSNHKGKLAYNKESKIFP